MLAILRERFRQKYRTMRYPAGPAPALPERFLGRPMLDPSRCRKDCRRCADACPTGAISCGEGAGELRLDMGRCLFCSACREACPEKCIAFTRGHELAAGTREDLIVTDGEPRIAQAFRAEIAKRFGRSLKLRQVSAGGCNACEADVNVLGTVAWDLGRFGIQFVASPRHADGLLITGPVPEHMRSALQKTYEAVPLPKIVIASGSCAVAGGPYIDHPEVQNGAAGIVPVDLFIPGCPPHPLTILDGLLRLLGRIEEPATK